MLTRGTLLLVTACVAATGRAQYASTPPMVNLGYSVQQATMNVSSGPFAVLYKDVTRCGAVAPIEL
jgi:hypothetical protein